MASRLGRQGRVTLFLAGDVMCGRGIDQILPNPCDPRLHESSLTSARQYLELAEDAHGPIPSPVDFDYVWGESLEELALRRPDARIVNLETAVTRSDRAARKGINYRMSPENVPVLSAARIDCCALANNHVLDWGDRGLIETLDTLRTAGIKTVGAGRNHADAGAPAILPLAERGRVLVFAFGSPGSGIPAEWRATPERPGINLLPDLSLPSAMRVAEQVRAARRAGDICVASIHWGPNWGHEVRREQVAFAHALVDQAGIDLVHGHSSHHAKSIEVYKGKLILYGCGDLLNDYEGIEGQEAFRSDLALMYFATVDAACGTLVELAMVALQIRNFRLSRASAADATWLCESLSKHCERFGTRVGLGPGNVLILADGSRTQPDEPRGA